MITDVPGVAVGHWSDHHAATGCTVVLFPEGAVASGEVRGGAPGTREFALLDPSRMVQRIDAVVLAGGSAHGLAAADGVMRWCEERSRGFSTAGGIVPIVIGMVLYDLAIGDGSVRPTALDGLRACNAAATGPHAVGQVGAGTGATVGKWRAPDEPRRRGGIGAATMRHGDVIVSALIAVNAWGDVIGPEGPDAEVLADGLAAAGRRAAAAASAGREFADSTDPTAPTNTTIGVVATNARLTKGECLLAAQSAHDGLARALAPVHTTADGDAMVAVSVPAPDGTAQPEASLELVRFLVAEATTRAIRSLGPTA